MAFTAVGMPRSNDSLLVVRDASAPPSMQNGTGVPAPIGARAPVGASEPATSPKEVIAAGEVEVGPGVELKGAVLGRCVSIRVRGYLEAEEASCQLLTIDRGGTFKGSVTASKAEIQGEFQGRLSVAVLLIQRPARVEGHLEYDSIQIEAGAVVSGTLQARS
jgi:cytoskeletal protein CcmA (bactofilin family)